ncbi:hypothetical protein ACGIF2_11205 [Cellulomonas sp. P22]|uniref:hypothetical protein n=1 Tax=Cellulomonas sp. P22 TaxID=3373189 RepID=UPI0037BBDCF1
MITAHQARNGAFSRTRAAASYDMTAVDRMMERVAETLEALEQGRTVGPDGERLLLPRDLRGARPPEAMGAGYAAEQVDAVQAEMIATLEEYVRRFAAPRTEPADAPASRTTAPTTPATASVATTPMPAPAPALPPVDLTDAPTGGLGAYDVMLGVQAARASLFGVERDHLRVRTADGTLSPVVAVETVADGIVVHVR